MTKQELEVLLYEQTGFAEIMLGYNYTAFSIKTKSPALCCENLKRKHDLIEHEYRITTGNQTWSLLPYVALSRSRTTIIPVPFDTQMNVLAEIVKEILVNMDIKIPSWS